jgi:acetyl esterase/lipase
MSDGKQTLSPRDRIAGELVRFLCGRSPRFQRLVAGRPVVIDGQQLETEIQLLLKLTALSPEPELTTLSPSESRVELHRLALALEGPKVPVGRVESLEVPGPAGPIGARLYVPEGELPPLPMLVYLHGGGWVRGDLDTHDNNCRFLAREAGVLVLSVDYRLAPEHPFPAAVEDSLAAFRWAHENAADLDGDAAAIAVGGDSAGGNLTAVVGQLTAADGGPVPAFLLVIYPATDFSEKRRSVKLFSEGFLLTESDMDWYTAHYLADEQAALDPRASPLLAEDLSGVPPAYVVTAGFDPLRDEGEAYALRLREAGVPVALRRHRGLVHGFANMTGVGRTGRGAMLEAAGALRVGVSRAATLTRR